MISHIEKTGDHPRVARAALYVALAFSIFIPAIQLLLHILANSNLFGIDPTSPQTGVGVLYNLPDAMSYASWAYQAKLGHITFSDLFTTDAHPQAFFNLYFLAVGAVSRLTTVDPLLIMEVSSFLLGPVAVFAVLLIARELKFGSAAQAFSLVFVFVGSGLSGLFLLLQTYASGPIAHLAWLSHALQPGADTYYFDLFPLPSLAYYPYHAASFALAAFTLLMVLKSFGAGNGPDAARRAAVLGMFLLILGLSRPYEALALTAVFNATVVFNVLSTPRPDVRKALALCALVDLLAFPPLAYAAFMTTLPVWGGFAKISMTFSADLGAWPFIEGFFFVWAFAGSGLVFAVADRKRDLFPIGCWAVLAAALLMLSPSYGTKLAGGSVLADGLLAGHGIARLLQRTATSARRGMVMRLLVGIICVMALSPFFVFAAYVEKRAPRVDTDLIAAGERIRQLEGTRIPTVLTDIDAGGVLPGLFGERVYAGHWSLTPHYEAKAKELERAGIAASGSPGTKYDPELLGRLIGAAHADYILLNRNAAAVEAAKRCTQSEPAYSGSRWIAVKVSGWSCR